MPAPRLCVASVSPAVLFVAVAAAVLLDRRMALGTLLRVRRNPVRRLRVVLTLLKPLLDQHAWARLVVRECAAEAKAVFAFAMHGWNNPVQISLLDSTLNGVHAVRRRTPLKIFLVVYVRTHEELVIAICEVDGDKEVEGFGVYNPIAAISRALNACGLAFASYLLGEI